MKIKATSLFSLIEFYLNGEHFCKCVIADGFNNHFTLIRNDKILATMKPKYKFPFKFYTEITMNNENILLKSCGGFFRPFYNCVYKNETYEVFLHKNPHISIFKKNIQVASITSKYINKINYKINSEILYEQNEIDLTFLMTIFCSIEFPEDTLESAISEKRKFNYNWIPKN